MPPLRGGGAEFASVLRRGFVLARSRAGGFVLALAGGADWRPAMAGALHPPFSLFIPRMKRENGPCTVQKRKAGGRGLRGAVRYRLFITQVSSPRRSASGGLEVEVRSARLSPLPLTWRLVRKEGLPIFVGRPSSFVFRPSSFVPPRGHISFTLLDRARPVFSFSSGRKSGAPAKSKILWGEEEGTEQSGVLAVRRGRSGRSFFRRHGGCNEPAIADIQSAPPARASTGPPRLLGEFLIEIRQHFFNCYA